MGKTYYEEIEITGKIKNKLNESFTDKEKKDTHFLKSENLNSVMEGLSLAVSYYVRRAMKFQDDCEIVCLRKRNQETMDEEIIVKVYADKEKTQFICSYSVSNYDNVESEKK